MSNFVNITDEEINDILQGRQSNNTKYQTTSAGKYFSTFLKTQNAELSQLSKTDLDVMLQKYFPSLRTCNNDFLKKGTLLAYRFALSRFITETYPHPISITEDIEFKKSSAVFAGLLKKMKEIGKGCTTHYEAITTEDITKINNLDESSPVQLQWKTWFYVHYFFCRRGKENSDSMKKNSFGISYDTKNRKYLHQIVDELTKNHRNDNEETTQGRMYENENRANCPVTCFEKYVSKLNPNNEFLWQRPKLSFTESDQIWYVNAKIGHNKISTFMPEISNACLLSKRYTNHSIRVTVCSLLGEAGFSDIEVQTVSGHQSIASLGIYKRPGEKRKLKISECLTSSLSHTESLGSTSSKTVLTDATNEMRSKIYSTFQGSNNSKDAFNIHDITGVQKNDDNKHPPGTMIFYNCNFNFQ